jgi:hypothetical protein
MAGQCEHVRADGQRCKARAIRGERFCFFHSPGKAREAGRKGGSRSKKPAIVIAASPDALPLNTVADVSALLASTINQLRAAPVDVKAANAIGYLASVLLRALEGSDLLKRIEALEAERDRDGKSEATGDKPGIAPETPGPDPRSHPA